MSPSGYQHNGFVSTHAHGHVMHGYTLLVPMIERVLKKLRKEHNISGHEWSTTHRALKSHRSKMKYHKVIVVTTGRTHYFHENIYIMLILLLWDLSILCVVITYNYLYFVPCLACWALFGSLVPAMCNQTSCAQLHELSQSHCGDEREGTLFSW